MAKSKLKCKRTPKSILRLPDLEQSKAAVLNSLMSLSSQRTYDHAIREFIEWYCSEPRLAFNKTVVTRYRISLEQRYYASTTINLRLAAVRRLAYEAADCGLLSADLAAGIRRVKGAKRLGVPVGNWLTVEQGKRLLLTADGSSLRDKRDYATLAILLGCGLRRAELTALRVEDIQQREEHWVIADLVGKGACGPLASRLQSIITAKPDSETIHQVRFFPRDSILASHRSGKSWKIPHPETRWSWTECRRYRGRNTPSSHIRSMPSRRYCRSRY